MEYKVASTGVEWRPAPRVCRCCLSEGCYKDISAEYYWMGEKETYADMLRECFDLEITIEDGGSTSTGRLICEVCITRLRDASNFKKQVISCEKRFHQHISTGAALSAPVNSEPATVTEVKIEGVKDEVMLSDDDLPDAADDDDYDDPDYDESDSLPLKYEVQKKEAMADLSFGDEIPILSNTETTIRRVTPKSKEKPPSKKIKLKKKELTIKPVKAGSSKVKTPKEPKVKKAPKTARKGGESNSKEGKKIIKVVFQDIGQKTVEKSQSRVIVDKINRGIKYLRTTHPKILNSQLDFAQKNLICSNVKNIHQSKSRIDGNLDKPIKIRFARLHPSLLGVNKETGAILTMRKKKLTANDSIMQELPDKTKRNIAPNLKKSVCTLLLLSNAIPFRWHKSCFRCLFCPQSFIDPRAIRTHTIENHKNQNITQIKHSEEGIKMDIADLKCEACGADLSSLEDFRQHIKIFHGITLPEIFSKLIFPFNLSKPHQCAMCPLKFNKFMMLNQHINVHFNNFVCDICGKGSSTRTRHRIHCDLHIDKQMKCRYCDKIFKSGAQRCEHEQKHKDGSKYVCLECKIPCGSRQLFYEHRVKQHNYVEPRVKCDLCPRTYSRMGALNIHKRRFHMKERNMQCPLCSERLFNKKTLRYHMLKHTGEKNFICEYCNKAFGRKTTLREHIRSHVNDRRFKCPACAADFVQKCSLKGHILTHHKCISVDFLYQ